VPPPISVLLVTQIRLYAHGIATTLDDLEAINRVVVEPSCETALDRLTRDPTDVVLLDLAGIDDLAAAQAFVQAAPPARVVALAVHERDQDIVAWAEHGAMGIVTRQASFDDLVHAIVAAARGECGCSPRVATALVRRVATVAAERRRVPPYPALTLREREIVELLIEGLSNKEIASRLLLGVSTVKNHVHNVLRKVQARTRSEAVALLVEMKIQAQSPRGPDPTAV
jgi:two-component system, NarL family, nitrate/nitrite response regulator NarL